MTAARGEFTRLMARDGHEFDAWLVPASSTPRGAIVVLQEIFGVNSHIRAVANDFAAEGYVAIAPSLFDRVRRNVELDYSPSSVEQGRGYVLQLKEEGILADLTACINVVKRNGPVGVVGYCWGGAIAYLAACELPVRAAVCYYGTRIVQYLDRRPRVPVQYHFGEKDKTIPPENIEKIRAAHPEGEFHIYPADHGFNCDQRASWHAESARLARERTLAFFARHLAEALDDEQPLDNWGDA
ncbi:MAG: dienelactone hydrolase family protein [Pseudomonadota bacterium]|jgi:carboxymethylenebutenolidase|nr:MAG: carboxymethylenebutenolidase [Pseudomonadota bacterium]